MLFEILLMLLFRAVKVHDRPHLYGNRLFQSLLQATQRIADHSDFPVRPAALCHIVNARTILLADIVSLAVLRRRIDGLVKQFQQLFERQNLRIVDDMHGFGMAAARAYLAIRWTRLAPVRVAALRRYDAGRKAQVPLRAPEAAAREVNLRLAFLRRVLLHDFLRHLSHRCGRRPAAAQTKCKPQGADDA